MITKQQLPDSPPTFVTLYCETDGATWSANRGDYWQCAPDEPMTCECGGDLQLVTRRTVYDADEGREWLQ